MARYAPYIRFACGCKSRAPCFRGARLFYQHKDSAGLRVHLAHNARVMRPRRAA